MREAYEYMGKIYLSDSKLDEAIEEAIGHDYNNGVGLESAVEREFYNYVDKLNADDWETFKDWCIQENLKPSYASSVERYYKELEAQDV
jgi:hypothetical protein